MSDGAFWAGFLFGGMLGALIGAGVVALTISILNKFSDKTKTTVGNKCDIR